MAFSEDLKRAVRRRCDMRCCVCRTTGVEIHHIVPQAEGGPDSEDNAAPLCPSCHEMLGANPTKRKFIREARDNWFEVCDQRFAAQAKIDRLVEYSASTATRADLENLRSDLLNAVARIVGSPDERPRERTLGEILRHVFDFTRSGAKNGVQQATWLYEFVWGNALGDAEYEEVKNELVETFGRETARRLCHFVLQDHPYDILSCDGFTVPEMAELVHNIIVASILLLHHVDLVRTGEGLVLGIEESGDIRAWSAEHHESLQKK